MDQEISATSPPRDKNAPFNWEENGVLFCVLLALWLAVAIKVCLKDKQDKADRDEFYGVFSTLNTTVGKLAAKEEYDVPIKKLYVYPCRGIRGCEVSQVQVSKYGIRYDREWMIIDAETKRHISQSNSPQICSLRQRVEKGCLVIYPKDKNDPRLKDFKKKELFIDLDIWPNDGDLIKAKNGAEGYPYKQKINDWISAMVNKKAILIRSPPDRLQPLDAARLIQSIPTDRRKSFTTDASIHMINQASLRELKTRLKQNNSPEQMANIDVDEMSFRPNFVIDTQTPFEEDLFQEARIGPCFFRNVGPCIRCKAICINAPKMDRNPELEPNDTLAKFRRHKNLGLLFGMYWQQEVLYDNDLLERALPRDQGFNEEYNIVKPLAQEKPMNIKALTTVKKGDKLKIRLQKEMPWRIQMNEQCKKKD